MAVDQKRWRPFHFADKSYSNSLSNHPPQVIQLASDAIRDSIVYLGGTFGRFGTGLHIGNGTVLTAAHVVRDIVGFLSFFNQATSHNQLVFPANYPIYKDARVHALPDFDAIDVSFLKSNNASFNEALTIQDWAVLNLPMLIEKKPIQFPLENERSLTSRLGAPVWVVGYPFSGNAGLYVSAGQLARDASTGKYYISGIQLQGGFSGGPVLTQDGTVIGLANTYFSETGFATFLPVDKLLAVAKASRETL